MFTHILHMKFWCLYIFHILGKCCREFLCVSICMCLPFLC